MIFINDVDGFLNTSFSAIILMDPGSLEGMLKKKIDKAKFQDTIVYKSLKTVRGNDPTLAKLTIYIHDTCTGNRCESPVHGLTAFCPFQKEGVFCDSITQL